MTNKKLVISVIALVIITAIGQLGFSWSISDPEIKDLGAVLGIRDYEGNEEFSLHFLYLNDRSINYVWDPSLVETVKQIIGDRNCFALTVFVEQDTYFWPTEITFVQEGYQYEIDYSDIVKISDTFSGHLRPGVKVAGFVFIPDGIDVYSPMKIYYDEEYTVFSVPESDKKEPTIEEKISQLEKEKAELETKIKELETRLDEVEQELETLRNRVDKDGD